MTAFVFGSLEVPEIDSAHFGQSNQHVMNSTQADADHPSEITLRLYGPSCRRRSTQGCTSN